MRAVALLGVAGFVCVGCGSKEAAPDPNAPPAKRMTLEEADKVRPSRAPGDAK